MTSQFWLGFLAGAVAVVFLMFAGLTFLIWWISNDEIDENKIDN